MESFQSLVCAVVENNKMNNGEWKDWDNALHIQDTYGVLKNEYKEVAETFLNALIRDNGGNLKEYLLAFHCLEWGY